MRNLLTRTTCFWTLQLIVAGGSVAWAAHRYSAIEAERTLPVPRDEPVRVGPLYDDPQVVSDFQLKRVLQKLRPTLRGPRPKINNVDHALRFWGVEAVFDDPHCLSGVEMRELLLDHRQFASAWGEETPPFLISEPSGLRIRTQEGQAAASHVDHTLATLGEVGTPLDYPVILPHGETSLRAVLEQSLRDFSLNQLEYEWSALAYALYLPHVNRWVSSEGQEITFDRLAERIMRQRLASGVCKGNHRLHALVMLLRVDEQQPILSTDGRARVTAYLQDVTRRLVASQHPDGYWDETWPGREVEGLVPQGEQLGDPLSNRLLVTGHVLEWWSLAPAEILPPHAVLVGAGQWLAETVIGLTPGQVRANYTYLTHAGRALALWRGRFPAELSREALPSKSPSAPSVNERKHSGSDVPN